MDGILPCVRLCDWPISLSMSSSRFTHAAACLRVPFLFEAEQPCARTTHRLPISLSVDTRLP